VLARGDEVIEQSGDFRSWHFSDIAFVLGDVRSQGLSGNHLLFPSISPFDP
jgi:hypothetical protein